MNKPLLCRRFVSSFVVGRRSLFQGFVGTAFFFISLWVHRPPFCGGSLAGVWRSPACLPFDQHKFLLHHFQSTANDTRRGSSSADDWSDDGNAVRCCGGGVGGDSALCFVWCACVRARAGVLVCMRVCVLQRTRQVCGGAHRQRIAFSFPGRVAEFEHHHLRRVNDYEILTLLGKGAQGAVYKVGHVETGEYYAMKVFDKIKLKKKKMMRPPQVHIWLMCRRRRRR